MPRYLLDTDHLTLFEHGHVSVIRRMNLQPVGAVGICVVTVEEAPRGRLAASARAADGPSRIYHYAKLAKTILFLTQLPTVPYDQSAEDEFQQIRSIHIGTKDLRIASIAMANRLIVVTRDRRDFARVPGLMIEDWSI